MRRRKLPILFLKSPWSHLRRVSCLGRLSGFGRRISQRRGGGISGEGWCSVWMGSKRVEGETDGGSECKRAGVIKRVCLCMFHRFVYILWDFGKCVLDSIGVSWIFDVVICFYMILIDVM